jgi:hypothetical protein
MKTPKGIWKAEYISFEFCYWQQKKQNKHISKVYCTVKDYILIFRSLNPETDESYIHPLFLFLYQLIESISKSPICFFYLLIFSLFTGCGPYKKVSRKALFASFTYLFFSLFTGCGPYKKVSRKALFASFTYLFFRFLQGVVHKRKYLERPYLLLLLTYCFRFLQGVVHVRKYLEKPYLCLLLTYFFAFYRVWSI